MAVATSSVFFQNTAGRLMTDEGGFLRTYWHAQPRTLADTQALFEHMALALRQHGWHKILVNQVGMLPFSPEEQQWVAQQWLPHAVQESGYHFGAVIVGRDIYTRLATAFITTNVGSLPLRYRSFDDEDAAAAWLQQQA